MAKEISRRSFLKAGTAAAVGLSVAPGLMAKKKKKTEDTAPLNRKLKILAVGIGGRGSSVLKGLETEDIIGLCDVDWKYAMPVFERYPNAKRYNDYKVMFAELLDEADAVMVRSRLHTLYMNHAFLPNSQRSTALLPRWVTRAHQWMA